MLLNILSILFILLGALFKMFDELGDKLKKVKTRGRYTKIWRDIENINNDFSTLIFDKLLNESNFLKISLIIYNNFIIAFDYIIIRLTSIILIVFSSYYLTNNYKYGYFSIIYLLSLIFQYINLLKLIRKERELFTYHFEDDEKKKKYYSVLRFKNIYTKVYRYSTFFYTIVLIYLSLLFINPYIKYTLIALNYNNISSLIIKLKKRFKLSKSIFRKKIYNSLYLLNENIIYIPHRVLIMMVYVILSIYVTQLMLLFGRLFSNYLVLPNIQILIANILFDVFTVFFTLNLIKKAREYIDIVIFLFFIIDVIFAAIFAVLSVYFSFLFTEHEFTLNETFMILIGRSLDNNNWNFDSYFWLMHTSFIPTLLYLVIIIFIFVSKYITIPFLTFFKFSKSTEKPYNATAVTFVFLGTFLLSIQKIIEIISE